jgi:Tol biopolymer transport system component
VRDVPPPGTSVIFSSDLFVVNSDGTETRLTRANGFVAGGSFSPDGSKVVYSVSGQGEPLPSSISVVDASGGTPHTLRTANGENVSTL